jgi:hypothetical protein
MKVMPANADQTTPSQSVQIYSYNSQVVLGDKTHQFIQTLDLESDHVASTHFLNHMINLMMKKFK